MTDNWYLGTDLKLQLTITASGFNMNTGKYDIVVSCGGRTRQYNQDTVVSDGSNHYLVIPTETLCPGILKLKVTAYVPDADAPGNLRKEVTVIDAGIIRPALL